ncbi:uncharacterized protein Pyn_21989 [Prunus yedoensis var. nudiflora]|uniref:U1-type domain-containing protein n=1 Tax=Prunus yedoensis var. nudiflora TaxID=2094558 RepID=A0A314XZL1_PRUYE|nr:uncharacterized protein Pyn_21989 [Prunus yedoensis var. nudiflora]
MEFNFRSHDKRSPPPLPSTLGCFSQHPHALRATQQTQTAAMIERQLEKEKIREEIMAAERRRLLEAEAKPDPNLSGVKRKTPPTAGASELPPTGLKKKPKEIWSCAMCQVSARSQKVFNQHLNGKKHKANEARLRAQKLGKSSSSAPLSKQTAKFSEPEEVRELLDPSDGLDEKMQDACTSKEKKEELPMQKDQCREDLKIQDEVEVVQGPGRKEAVRKKKFKFWCERCKVGAYSPNVMLAHMTGKKHIAKCQEVTPSNVPIASSLASSVEAIRRRKMLVRPKKLMRRFQQKLPWHHQGLMPMERQKMLI